MSRMCTRFPFLLVIAGLAVTAFAQNQPAVNPSAVFKTMVVYQGAAIAGIRRARPVREGIPAAPTIFSGSPYTVGPTITPTSTVPEAEEHIAVDPSNFNNLVAMISDFSLRAGFNTSKFAPPRITEIAGRRALFL